MSPRDALQRATFILIVATWVVALVSLRVGAATGSRTLEGVLFGLAGVLSLIALIFAVWPTGYRQQQYERDRRWWRRAFVVALLAFGFAWVIAIVQIHDTHAKPPTPPPTAKTVGTWHLTVSEKKDVDRLVARLRQSKDPNNHQLGVALAGLAAGAPTAIASIGGLFSKATGTGQALAMNALSSLLRGSLRASLTMSNTLSIDHPTFSLGGFHVSLRIDARRGQAKKRQGGKGHDGPGPDPVTQTTPPTQTSPPKQTTPPTPIKGS